MSERTGLTPWWEKDTTPGYLLVAAAVLSFVLQNSALTPAWQAFLHQPVQLTIPGYHLDSYVRGMVKDALMAVFFLFVGLELKREVIEGPFRNPRQAALPALGALGGMAAPALIYLAVSTHLHPEASMAYAHGWAIPTATDIAFAVGVLSLLGARVPAGLRLFLLALAIADDLGAIVVIALFYSGAPQWGALAIGAAIFALMTVLNARGVRALTPYWVLGLFMWMALSESGVSPTLAGVFTAAAIPMRRPDGRMPLIAAEHALKPYVQLGIMPLFALVMAGVPLAGVDGTVLLHPVTLGIGLGLVLGKPLGIFSLTVVGAKLLGQPLPCRPLSVFGASMIAGIGFTMSLFVGALAFYGAVELEAPIRLGVLGGTVVSAVCGLLCLSLALPKTPNPPIDPDIVADEQRAEERGVLEDLSPDGRTPTQG